MYGFQRQLRIFIITIVRVSVFVLGGAESPACMHAAFSPQNCSVS